MLDLFFFVGLPYAAIVALVAGTVYRYRKDRYGVSALTSQFLENRKLKWGALPWHIGLFIVLAGHAVAFLAPGFWEALTANRAVLVGIEVIGSAAGTLAFVGLLVLAYRRITTSRLQSVTSAMDFVILAVLLAQILTGLGTAHAHRWGAAWATQTLTPYLWNLATLRPDVTYVTGLPPMVQAHVAAAWVVVLLIPFSRLIHMFSVPLHYAFRAPQKVVWATARRLERNVSVRVATESRRHFLRASLGMGAAGALLGVGVFDKLFNFFRGPAMAAPDEVELLKKKLHRLEQAAHERELELERKGSDFILVAQLGELSATEGKYFTDYQMRPALAFKGPDGWPLLVSAKCTHLGCTVASTLDTQGRLLCPCHISYFDLKTGQPNPGSPAKTPLPHLGWVIRDPGGNILASRGPQGVVEGGTDPAALSAGAVYIAKRYEESA